MFWSGCSAPGDGSCTPGKLAACSCEDGATGFQRCTESAEWDPPECVCNAEEVEEEASDPAPESPEEETRVNADAGTEVELDGTAGEEPVEEEDASSSEEEDTTAPGDAMDSPEEDIEDEPADDSVEPGEESDASAESDGSRGRMPLKKGVKKPIRRFSRSRRKTPRSSHSSTKQPRSISHFRNGRMRDSLPALRTGLGTGTLGKINSRRMTTTCLCTGNTGRSPLKCSIPFLPGAPPSPLT